MSWMKLLAVAAGIAGLVNAPLAAEDDFARDRGIILERLRDIGPDGGDELLADFRDDGTWSDIDYTNLSRGSWKPMTHLSRARSLARRHPEIALKALAAWDRMRLRSLNWWGVCIGVPDLITDTMIRLRMENVPPDLQTRLRTFFEEPSSPMTGQNLVSVANIRFKEGLLYNEPALAAAAREKVLGEVRRVPPGEEGMQQDYSFHQHGTQLQFGNYGLWFFRQQARWAGVLRGTSLAYPPEKIALLETYLMEGLRWTLWDEAMDFSACGREQAYGNPAGKYRWVLDATRELLPALPAESRERVRAWLEDPAALTGARAFPNSGYLVYFSPDKWRFSVKMDSAKLIGSEVVNRENLTGLYQGDGAAFFGATIRYEGYPALPDARMIPGTTEIQDDRPLLPLPGHKQKRNPRGFYAVWADFPVAAAAMRLDTDDLTADKVWFCTPAGVTAAGSDIRSTSDAPVVTCIDQYREESEAAFPVVCEVPAGMPPAVRTVEERRANWKQAFQEKADREVAGRVVKLFIDHGVKPEGAGYFCRLRKADAPPAEAETRLAADSPRIHAIAAAGRILAAAFVPGTVTLPDGRPVKVEPGITVFDPAGKVIARAAFRER